MDFGIYVDCEKCKSAFAVTILPMSSAETRLLFSSCDEERASNLKLSSSSSERESSLKSSSTSSGPLKLKSSSLAAKTL